MHLQISLLLTLTAFWVPFFPFGSTSTLRSSPPPLPAFTTAIGTKSTSLDPPPTNALLPRAPEKPATAPSLRCKCRKFVTWSDCIFYRILNWPTEPNVINKLHDELIQCGAKNFALLKYYLPEKESGLGAFACFRLPHIYKEKCWTRAVSRALGTKVEECKIYSPGNKRGDPLPWWEDTFRTRSTGTGIRYTKPPPDYTFPLR